MFIYFLENYFWLVCLTLAFFAVGGICVLGWKLGTSLKQEEEKKEDE